jgi:hypothetical protein
MEHNDIRHKLSEYIDGAVTAQERSEIENHLSSCSACKDALTELQKTIEHIKAIEEIEPPAWLSQKIMATVRAETEQKKGFFHRYFFPLRVKLPIQAVAVLFLAVTAFYINQAVHLTPELSETPIQEFTGEKGKPLISTEQDTFGKTDASALRSKKVAQSPEYKALDMKLEYERPARPMIEDRVATPVPAPSKPAEQAAPRKDNAAMGNRASAPHAGESALMREQQATSVGRGLEAGIMQESEPSLRKRKAGLAQDKVVPTITYVVSVKDLETAARDLEAAFEKLGGTLSKKERLESRSIYTIMLSAQRFSDLSRELKLIGVVTEKAAVPELWKDRTTVRIELEIHQNNAL